MPTEVNGAREQAPRFRARLRTTTALGPAPFELHCSAVPRSSRRNPPEEHYLSWPCLDLTSSQSRQSRREGQSAATDFSLGPSIPPFLPHCLFVGRKARQVSQVPLPSSERTAAPSWNAAPSRLHEGLAGRRLMHAHTVRPPVVCLKSRGLFKSVQPPHGISCALWSPLFFDSAFQLSASFHRAAQQSLCNQIFSPSGTRKVLAGLQQEGNPFG